MLLRWSRELIFVKRNLRSILVGRPRKFGKREKNGQLQRVYVNPKAQVAAQPHRKVVMLKHRDWPEAESEFGRLMLNGKITPAQYEAGKLYAELLARYLHSIDSPALHPVAMNLERAGRSYRHGMDDETAKRAHRRYDDAFCDLSKAGHRVTIAVKNFAIMEKPVESQYDLTLLIIGLDRLVAYFGVDKGLQITSREK